MSFFETVFTNTGLSTFKNNLAVSNFDDGVIHVFNKQGVELSSITLSDNPLSTIQGNSYDLLRDSWLVCHYSATPGSGNIKRYSNIGDLQTFNIPSTNSIGPNDCCYDPVNDRVLTCWNDGVIRGFSALDGTLEETISIDQILVSTSPSDGITIDLNGTDLWVSIDAPMSKIAKIKRDTGLIISSYDFPPGQEEGITFLDGLLYVCSDRLFHESLIGGNRIYAIEPSLGLEVSKLYGEQNFYVL